MKNNKGFTLIELLVVVLIIGILAAIALPQYFKAVEKSRAAEASTVLGAVNHAEAVYKMATDGYTSDFAALDVELTGLNDGTTTNIKQSDDFTYTIANDAASITAARRTTGGYELTLTFADSTINCDPKTSGISCGSLGF